MTDLINTLQDYNVYSLPRATRGGGVAVIARKGFQVKRNNSSVFSSFETLDLAITSGNKQFRLLTIYRPRATKKNNLSTPQFFSDFSKFLEELIATPNKLILAGDFNFHVDNPTNTEARKFLDLLDSAGLQQHVDGPTHRDGHTLDLIITRCADNFISKLKILPELPSDHKRVLCNVDLPGPAPTRKSVTYRKLRNVDIEKFSEDIAISSLNNLEGSDLDIMIDQYNEILCSLLNKHAPLRSREIILRPHAPWFSDELRELKREKRRLERKYVNTNLTVHKEMYQMICTEYTKHIEAAKTEYFRKKVEDASHDQLFKFVDKFLNVKKAPILPKHESSKELAERFSEHFQMKITGIRRELSASSLPSLTIEDHETCLAPPLSCFQPVSPSEIKRFIMSSKTKSCQLDPVPTWILKGCINQLLPTITEIINSSLEQGHFPSKLKESIVYPLLKKPALDPEDNNNFHPISNLLLFNDINTAIDNQHEFVLVLLDLSAAFDTIDHKILINRLENKYGISGLALEWLRSYLQERPQRVIVNGTYSDPKYNSFGVPQGSVLGPLLFSLSYGPLEDVIRAHGIDTMMYADDCQLYIIIKRSNRRVALDQLELCIDDVLRWKTQNGLKCNPSKTEVIHFYSRYMPSDSISHLRVGNQ